MPVYTLTQAAHRGDSAQFALDLEQPLVVHEGATVALAKLETKPGWIADDQPLVSMIVQGVQNVFTTSLRPAGGLLVDFRQVWFPLRSGTYDSIVVEFLDWSGAPLRILDANIVVVLIVDLPAPRCPFTELFRQLEKCPFFTDIKKQVVNEVIARCAAQSDTAMET